MKPCGFTPWFHTVHGINIATSDESDMLQAVRLSVNPAQRAPLPPGVQSWVVAIFIPSGGGVGPGRRLCPTLLFGGGGRGGSAAWAAGAVAAGVAIFIPSTDWVGAGDWVGVIFSACLKTNSSLTTQPA